MKSKQASLKEFEDKLKSDRRTNQKMFYGVLKSLNGNKNKKARKK